MCGTTERYDHGTDILHTVLSGGEADHVMSRHTMQGVPSVLSFPVAFFCGAVSVLGGCAGQVMPSGGPPDTVPPVIIGTLPESCAVRVVPSSIELEFSEYVERRTLEESVFISPYVGQPEFDWSGTRVSIRFPEALRNNTTYVVIVGTDVSDLQARGGNKMAHAYSLAFSTGDSIDRGMIHGRVFDENPDGIMIFAYNLRDMTPDTLDPTHTRPQYIMQTGKDGTFSLKNIVFGTYRVIAVRDEYRNLFYDREIDQFGVTTEDPVVNESRPEVRDLWFRMSKEDTTRPFLANVTAPDRRHILVRFSEPVDTLSVSRAVFALTDTATGASHGLGAQYPNMANHAVVTLETDESMDSAKVYRLVVRGVVDRSGNRLDSNNASSEFNGPSVPDTVKPYPIVRDVADSARGIAPGRIFEVDFKRPVDLSAALQGISLVDSALRPVPLQVRPRTPAELFVVPSSPLQSFSWYTFRICLDSVRDSRGEFLRDSTFRLRFQTLDSRLLGSIEGTIAGSFGDHAVVVTARTTDLAPQRSREIRVRQAGKFAIDQLPEGKYGIQAFEDLNGDGQYRAGLPYPFSPGARFTVWPDTVKVRARWSVEGVEVKFR